jgi:nucleoredoxin
MDIIIGKTFRRGKETVDLENIQEAKDFIAIYFGAHWAPPCRLFTPTLAEFYNKINSSQKRIEVIFCSIDGNEAAFERNFAEMPWTAVPYTDE